MTGNETKQYQLHPSARAVAFFDFDGTVTCLDSFLLLGLYACWERVGRVSLPRLLRSLMDYQRSRLTNTELKEAVLSDLSGLTRDEMSDLSRRLFDRLVRPSLRVDLEARIDQHNRAGHLTVLLSASLEEQLLPAAEYLQVREVIGTKVQYSDGRLTGRVEGEACHGAEKARLAKAFCEAEGIQPGESWAYGDSLSDVSVLDLCGNACVVNGGRRLRRIARQKGWEILRSPTPFCPLIEGLVGVHRV